MLVNIWNRDYLKMGSRGNIFPCGCDAVPDLSNEWNLGKAIIRGRRGRKPRGEGGAGQSAKASEPAESASAQTKVGPKIYSKQEAESMCE